MKSTQIDIKLQAIQIELDRIADKTDKDTRKRLKVLAFNIGCVREDLERAATGKCKEKCQHFNPEILVFEMECFGCKRYHPDLFTPRSPTKGRTE